MITPRRRLGTGPSTPDPLRPTTEPGARLLPIERADPAARPPGIERQAVAADRTGRRALGEGPTRQ